MRFRLILAGWLALAMVVVGGGSPAAALDWKDLTKVEKLSLYGPTVQTGKGLGKFALGATPPGRAWKILSAAALAWGAYEGADYLLNARQPGGSAGDWLGAGGAFPSTAEDARVRVEILGLTAGNTRNLDVRIKCLNWATPPNPELNNTYNCGPVHSSSPPYGNIGVGGGTTNQTAKCKHNTTGVVTTYTYIAGGSVSGNMPLATQRSSLSGGAPGAEWETKSMAVCPLNTHVEGIAISDATSETTIWRVHQPIGWGSLQGSTLPEGDLQFEHAVIEAKCRNAETDAVQTIRTVSAWGASETLVIPSCKQRLGEDWYGIGVKVIPMDPSIDDVPLDPEIWPDWDVPDFMPEEWTEGEVTPEEEADPCHGTSHGCPLSIEIDGEPVYPGTTTRTKIDTLRANEPDRVKCYVGQRAAEWKLCIPLLPGFEPGAGTSTTIDPTKPVPETGTPPTTGTGTQPVPTEAASCMKAAFSWNPVDWVFVPVKCALQWAFKPSTAFSTRIARVKTAFESKPPFSWLLSLGSLPSISGGGCPSHWQFGYDGEDYPILCGTAIGDALHAFRPVSVVLVLGAAVYPFVRALVYAAFPVIKPVPHD